MTYNLFPLKQIQEEGGVIFEFSGPFSQSLLAEMGDLLKYKMKLESASTQTILKVFSMVVEQAQNIIHYSAEKLGAKSSKAPDLSTGMIVVGLNDDQYFINCGNLVANKDVPHITKKLELVQKMTGPELKQYYKEQRRVDPDRESKGAGLGFIEMARKSSTPIDFSFEPFDSEYSFFTVNTEV